ncbi:DUF4169 family protein [uncultured Paracoccus sp.]|uniref:DUF4169 family protein n=1 Tax=uncultured Paracoccus sp. TaxID=189685 RepID=UPI002638EC11|nr:DUF4169 family protein [uncultured Paracoccus sp.]
MSTVINLRQVRKSRARSDKRAAGDANAAKFGEAKALREARQAEAARAGHVLDAHRQDEAPEPPRHHD